MQTTKSAHADDINQVRAQLNTAKTLSPLVAAVLSTHGDCNKTEFHTALEKLGGSLQSIVNDVLKAISPQKVYPSMIASTSSALAPILATAWRQAPNQDSYPRVTESFLSLVQFIEPNPGIIFDDTMSRATSDSLATARALSKILPTVMQLEKLPDATRKLYLSSTSLHEFRDACRDDICRMAEEAAVRLVPEDGKQRNIAYRSALSCISEVYAECLAERFSTLTHELNHIKKGTPEQRTAFLDYARSCESGPLLDGFRERMEHVAKEVLYPPLEAPEPESRPSY